MWPGLYQRSGGELRALNAPEVDAGVAATTADWRDRIGANELTTRIGIDATPTAIFLAIGCVAIAALIWKRRSARTTVGTRSSDL
jgi:hypothetical protein